MFRGRASRNGVFHSVHDTSVCVFLSVHDTSRRTRSGRRRPSTPTCRSTALEAFLGEGKTGIHTPFRGIAFRNVVFLSVHDTLLTRARHRIWVWAGVRGVGGGGEARERFDRPRHEHPARAGARLHQDALHPSQGALETAKRIS